MSERGERMAKHLLSPVRTPDAPRGGECSTARTVLEILSTAARVIPESRRCLRASNLAPDHDLRPA